jgi:drug/metabolite transporter (DMT)-like permease
MFAAIISTALGQFFYKKYALTSERQYFILTVFLFLITPVCSFFALKKIPMDIVYVSTSLTIFFVVIFSRVFLNERINKRRYLGIGLILLGVMFYAL